MKFLLTLISLVLTTVTFGQNGDSLLVVETTQKYIRAFYEGKPENLREVLHPELVKRTLKSFPESDKFIATSGQSEMVELSKIFNVRGRYSEKSRADIEVQDIFNEMAAVKLNAESWVDYLHLVKINGRWQIINVLWLMN